MTTTAEYYSKLKSKKSNIDGFLRNVNFNHPDRLASVAIGGELSYTIDERDFTSPGTRAYVYVFSLDYDLFTPYTRRFEPNAPWAIHPMPSGALAESEFSLYQRISSGTWKANPIYGPTKELEVIGTVSRTAYTRFTTSDPWVMGANLTEDLEAGFRFFIGGGGDPTSGGFNPDPVARASFAFRHIVVGTGEISADPFIPFDIFTITVYRFPWGDFWENQAAIFVTKFADHLTAENTADGGGHSGTVSLTLTFT